MLLQNILNLWTHHAETDLSKCILALTFDFVFYFYRKGKIRVEQEEENNTSCHEYVVPIISYMVSST